VLINNDALLQKGVAGAFQEYNTEQYTPVDMPGQSYKVLVFRLFSFVLTPSTLSLEKKNEKVVVSKFGQVDSSHYLDPRSNQVFSFDHMRQVSLLFFVFVH